MVKKKKHEKAIVLSARYVCLKCKTNTISAYRYAKGGDRWCAECMGDRVERQEAVAVRNKNRVADVKAKIVKKKKNRVAKPKSQGHIAQLWKKRSRYVCIVVYGARCLCCGREPSKHGVAIHVDHVKPKAIYPELEYDPMNIQPLCSECNQGKLHEAIDDFRTGEMVENMKKYLSTLDKSDAIFSRPSTMKPSKKAKRKRAALRHRDRLSERGKVILIKKRRPALPPALDGGAAATQGQADPGP